MGRNAKCMNQHVNYTINKVSKNLNQVTALIKAYARGIGPTMPVFAS